MPIFMFYHGRSLCVLLGLGGTFLMNRGIIVLNILPKWRSFSHCFSLSFSIISTLSNLQLYDDAVQCCIDESDQLSDAIYDPTTMYV